MFFFLRGLLLGMNAAFSFPVAALYRYPYYFPLEALKGDFSRIDNDIRLVLGREEGYVD